MLIKILSLFQERNVISLSDLSIHFNTDDDTMQAMLHKLIDKDLIESVDLDCGSYSSNCKGCNFANEKNLFKLK